MAVMVSLVPVVLFIALGYLSGRLGWVKASSVRDLSNIVFLILTPALLFRTMSQVRVQELNLETIAVYFLAAGLLFVATLFWQGFTTLGAARALAHCFSNNIMIGVPLVGMVFGEQGLVTLFTIVSVHALILMTSATIVFELAVMRQQQAAQGGQRNYRAMATTVGRALKNGIIHPIPLPIICGLLFAQTGLQLPEVLDKSLQMLAQALGPIALMLVGITLFYSAVGRYVKQASRIAMVKLVLHPVVLLAVGWLWGLRGLPLVVLATAAALPVGANVFLFTQRYEVGREEVTASIAVSTSLALLTIPLILLGLAQLLKLG
ncbi:AEC family transporter [Comamonas sp. J-3]|uniref:AEC family transporter n=1 Tax=Comamonas trifloxystrobinivorans TaxID=3350256 RepID=UPI00372C7CF5